MEKLIVTLLATCALCSAASLKTSFDLDRWSILKCSSGNLTGLTDFVELFENVVQNCNDSDSSRTFYECVGKNLAIVEDDGTPSLEKIHDFFVALYSEMILEDLPSFKQVLDECADEYVTNFNEINGAVESSETFYQCFTQATQEFSEDIEEVCRLEEAFNGKQLEADS